MNIDTNPPDPNDAAPEQRAAMIAATSLDLRKRFENYVPTILQRIHQCTTPKDLVPIAKKLREIHAIVSRWNIACGTEADAQLVVIEGRLLSDCQDIEAMSATGGAGES